MLMKIFQKYWDKIGEADEKRYASQTITGGVKEYKDISYIDDGKWQHKLDVYQKEDTNIRQPVIFDIHGGGWMYGTKEINKHYNYVLASRGYTVVSINYQLVPDGTVSGQLKDCFSALKWVGENIEKYNGDLNNLYITGDSAGGFLAAYTTLLNSSSELRKKFNVVDSGVHFVACALTSPVCFMNVKNITNLYYKNVLGNDFKNNSRSGFENFDSIIDNGEMPPTFLVTSSGDFVARKATVKAYNLIHQKNKECYLMNWERFKGKSLQHVFSVVNPYSEPGVKTIDAMLSFFKKYEKSVEPK